MTIEQTWTPDQCRALRWKGHPFFEGPHDPHHFYYGPNDRYMGHCAGRKDKTV